MIMRIRRPKILTILLEDDAIDVDLHQAFWVRLYKLRRYYGPVYSKSKFDPNLSLKPLDEFNYKILDVIRFTGGEIEYLFSKLICHPKYEEENNKVFARMDLLLELVKKYCRRVNGIKNRDRAKAKIERLSFVLESVKPNLNYLDQEANYRYLLAVYDEIKFNYPGATPYLKQRVDNLFRLFKNLMKIHSSVQFHKHNSPHEIAVLKRKRYFKWIFLKTEPTQTVLHYHYGNLVYCFSEFIDENFNFLLKMEKRAKELQADYLIKISFFGRLAEYIEEKAADPDFISTLDQKYRHLVGPANISFYKDLGRLELYLRRFIKKGKGKYKNINN
jgi:hypothetical protein